MISNKSNCIEVAAHSQPLGTTFGIQRMNAALLMNGYINTQYSVEYPRISNDQFKENVTSLSYIIQELASKVATQFVAELALALENK